MKGNKFIDCKKVEGTNDKKLSKQASLDKDQLLQEKEEKMKEKEEKRQKKKEEKREKEERKQKEKEEKKEKKKEGKKIKQREEKKEKQRQKEEKKERKKEKKKGKERNHSKVGSKRKGHKEISSSAISMEASDQDSSATCQIDSSLLGRSQEKPEEERSQHSTLNNSVTSVIEKKKEEKFKQKSERWKLTKEEIASVPTLIKPTIAQIDEKEISEMAEKMMKDIQNGKGKMKSIGRKRKVVDDDDDGGSGEKVNRDGKTEVENRSSKKKRVEKIEEESDKEEEYGELGTNTDVNRKREQSKSFTREREEAMTSREAGKCKERENSDMAMTQGRADDASNDKAASTSVRDVGKAATSKKREKPKQNGCGVKTKISNKEEMERLLENSMKKKAHVGKKPPKEKQLKCWDESSAKAEEIDEVEVKGKKSAIDSQMVSESAPTKTEDAEGQIVGEEASKKSKKFKKSAFAVPLKRDDSKTKKTNDKNDPKKTCGNLTNDSGNCSKNISKVTKANRNNGSKKSSVVKNNRTVCMSVLVEQNINVMELERHCNLDPKVTGRNGEWSIKGEVNSKREFSNHSGIDALIDAKASNVSSKSSTCNGDEKAEQRLDDEIISFQEASEIIAESFAIASPATEKKTAATDNRKTGAPLSDEMQASPLVPTNITDELPFSNLFKAVPECEGLYNQLLPKINIHF